MARRNSVQAGAMGVDELSNGDDRAGWNGPHRLQVTRGPSDDENRARVLDMDVTGGAPTPPPAAPLPILTARRTSGASSWVWIWTG